MKLGCRYRQPYFVEFELVGARGLEPSNVSLGQKRVLAGVSVWIALIVESYSVAMSENSQIESVTCEKPLLFR
ncbi:MAG: hypothetical protein ACREA9_01530 [Pyrinomonadaceae bacterium]